MPFGILENGVIIAEFVVPLTFRSNKPVFITDTLSLKRSRKARTAHRWELETRVMPMQGGAENLMVSLISADSMDPISVIVPQNTGVTKRRTSVATPSATGALGASQVTVANNAGLIPKGSFIRFSNHSKIYMTKNDITGNGLVNIFPTLRMAVNATTFNFREDVIMPCYYDTDVVKGMVYEDGILMDPGVIKLIEVV